MPQRFWEKGLKFECQGSGKCCVSRGGYGFVYLSQKDRCRMAKHLGLPTRQFTRDYCDKTDGWYHLKDLKGPCQFLRGKQCGIYEARPTQCRTWPFWPENMNPKTWTQDIARFCPGVGKGPVRTKSQIQKQLRQDSWTR